MEQALDSNAENIEELPQPEPENAALHPRLAVARLLRLQPEKPHLPPRSRIQRIPRFLVDKNPDLSKYGLPQMISFGPIHHRLTFSLGQQLKTTWARWYFEKLMIRTKNQEQYENVNDRIVSLYETITRKIPELRNLFSDDDVRTYDDGELADILFVDGCALLFFMDAVDERHPEKVGLVKLEQLIYIWRDAILLENQLPMQLLELLSYDQESQLYSSFYNFVFRGLPRRNREYSIFTWSDERKPAHLLDYIRLLYTSSSPQVRRPSLLDRSIGLLFKKEKTLPIIQEDPWHIHMNIRDLRKVGIRVEANKTSEWKWNNISFTSNLFSGQLMLPRIVIDDVAPYLYYNMIAYEMLPDSQNNFQCCSYFFLMVSLIDDAEDVKELRLAGVLQNLLRTDEEVAKLFNELRDLLPSKIFTYTSRRDALISRNIYILQQIDKHYRNKWKTWLAQIRNTYFIKPSSIINTLIALFALLLTWIQTWYAINPKRNS